MRKEDYPITTNYLIVANSPLLIFRRRLFRWMQGYLVSLYYTLLQNTHMELEPITNVARVLCTSLEGVGEMPTNPRRTGRKAKRLFTNQA